VPNLLINAEVPETVVGVVPVIQLVFCRGVHALIGQLKTPIGFEAAGVNGPVPPFPLFASFTDVKLEEFAKTHKLAFPVSTQGGQTVASGVGVTITPTTLFADEKGVPWS